MSDLPKFCQVCGKELLIGWEKGTEHSYDMYTGEKLYVLFCDQMKPGQYYPWHTHIINIIIDKDTFKIKR